MLQALKPFVVIQWSGREDEPMPDEIRGIIESTDLWKGHPQPIVWYVLDASAKPVGAFSPYREESPEGFSVSVLKKRLAAVTDKMSMPSIPAEDRAVRLPNTDGPGVRLFLTFSFSGARAPNNGKTPIVEAVPTGVEEREALAYSERAREVDAARLKSWLSQFYPPALMNSSGKLPEVSGILTWTPAGADAALLRGTVRFVIDTQPEASEYEATLQAVLAYRAGAPDYVSLRGVLTGSFPSQGRRRFPPSPLRLMAAIESLPD